MSPANRQRLLGLGLLVLLLVILVPWAMQAPPEFILDRDTRAPDALQITWTQPKPTMDKDIVAKTQQAIADERDEIVQASEADDQLLAWALALKTFDDKEQAEVARQQLNDAGYTAYLRATKDGMLLLAGPEINHEQLDELRQTLVNDERFHFDHIDVVRYLP